MPFKVPNCSWIYFSYFKLAYFDIFLLRKRKKTCLVYHMMVDSKVMTQFKNKKVRQNVIYNNKKIIVDFFTFKSAISVHLKGKEI